MATLEAAMGDDQGLDAEILSMDTADILTRTRLLENQTKILRGELTRMEHEQLNARERMKVRPLCSLRLPPPRPSSPRVNVSLARLSPRSAFGRW
jgi:hypothetical protein